MAQIAKRFGYSLNLVLGAGPGLQTLGEPRRMRKRKSRTVGHTGDMATLYTVRKVKIGRTAQMDELARAAGALYSQVVVWFWRTKRHKDLWLKAKHLMRWLTSALLHAHSSDAVVQSFFAALASWHARRLEDPDAKPPHNRKRFY